MLRTVKFVAKVKELWQDRPQGKKTVSLDVASDGARDVVVGTMRF